MVLWRFLGCLKCSGDLLWDEDRWRCFQCGHYYYTHLLQPVEHPPEPDLAPPQGGRQRASRNISSQILAKKSSDARWWERNRQLISYLDEGRSVREVAAVATQSKRAVRGVAARLADLKDANMRRKVLLADDEEAVLALVQATLDGDGRYQVILANNGEEAVRAAVREQPDLLFLDVMMPDMDGYEVCRLLRKEPSTADIKVIMLTAMAQDIDRCKALEVGADEYMTKPFSPTALLEKVEELRGK